MDDGAGGEATTVASWLNTAGYTANVKAANATVAGDLTDKQAVVFLSGSNGFPLGSSSARNLIEDWVSGGGRLLIEGGETGYTAFLYLPSFASNVLHMSTWSGDDAGSIVTVAGQGGHDLLNVPSVVTTPLSLNYSGESDQDAVGPASDAFLVLENANRAGTAGALVHDDNPIDPAAQLVYYPFALSALANQTQAQALVVNAVALLLDTGLPTGITDNGDGGPTAPPSLARISAIVPNPFNAHTVVRIDMLRAGPVRLEVYDVRGRLVRSLLDGHRDLSVGPHDFTWDGHDHRGQRVSSGVYFVRMSSGGIVDSGKLVRIR
jgi:hypothetical protein